MLLREGHRRAVLPRCEWCCTKDVAGAGVPARERNRGSWAGLKDVGRPWGEKIQAGPKKTI
jgi:hypothetical protein